MYNHELTVFCHFKEEELMQNWYLWCIYIWWIAQTSNVMVCCVARWLWTQIRTQQTDLNSNTALFAGYRQIALMSCYHVKHWLSLGQWLINKSVLKLTKNPKDLKLITDFSRRKSDLQPIFIIGKCVERLTSFKFLVSEDPHEDQPKFEAADHLLPLLHWECADVLHLCVVVKLHYGTQ